MDTATLILVEFNVHTNDINFMHELHKVPYLIAHLQAESERVVDLQRGIVIPELFEIELNFPL